MTTSIYLEGLRRQQAARAVESVGNVLDQWEQLPNDLKTDPGMEDLGTALDALTETMEAAPEELCPECHVELEIHYNGDDWPINTRWAAVCPSCEGQACGSSPQEAVKSFGAICYGIGEAKQVMKLNVIKLALKSMDGVTKVEGPFCGQCGYSDCIEKVDPFFRVESGKFTDEAADRLKRLMVGKPEVKEGPE